jgi:hypothetical protein
MCSHSFLLLLLLALLHTNSAYSPPSPLSCAASILKLSKSTSCVEVEFPALSSQNALGDGSRRSEERARAVNERFARGLLAGLRSPLVLLKGQAPVKAQLYTKGASLVPSTAYVFVCPATSSAYAAVKQVSATNLCVLVNAQAKDPRSLPAGALSAYYSKLLTYNSEVIGRLERAFPGDWTVTAEGAGGKGVLGSFTDEEILVPRTNTPDLRGAVALVQKRYSDRARGL